MTGTGREVLPIADGPHVGPITYDAKDPATSLPPIRDLRPPDGAPNVLIVLLDDVGFAASSAFGRPIATPVTDDLVEGQAAFTCSVDWVRIDLDEDAEAVDHLITPEARYRVAMARQ